MIQVLEDQLDNQVVLVVVAVVVVADILVVVLNENEKTCIYQYETSYTLCIRIPFCKNNIRDTLNVLQINEYIQLLLRFPPSIQL